MRKSILVALVLALAAAASAAPQKNKGKVKEKRFEPVVRADLSEYAGRYVGIDDTYVLEVAPDGSGGLRITSVEGERRAELKGVRVEGARVTATKVYEDGSTAKFEGLFAERVLNGERSFGVVVSGLDIKLAGLAGTRIFYRLFTGPARD